MEACMNKIFSLRFKLVKWLNQKLRELIWLAVEAMILILLVILVFALLIVVGYKHLHCNAQARKIQVESEHIHGFLERLHEDTVKIQNGRLLRLLRTLPYIHKFVPSVFSLSLTSLVPINSNYIPWYSANRNWKHANTQKHLALDDLKNYIENVHTWNVWAGKLQNLLPFSYSIPLHDVGDDIIRIYTDEGKDSHLRGDAIVYCMKLLHGTDEAAGETSGWIWMYMISSMLIISMAYDKYLGGASNPVTVSGSESSMASDKNYFKQTTTYAEFINKLESGMNGGMNSLGPSLCDDLIADYEHLVSKLDQNVELRKTFENIKDSGLIENLVEFFERCLEVLERTGHYFELKEYLENHKNITLFVQELSKFLKYVKERSDIVPEFIEFVEGTLEGKNHALKLIEIFSKDNDMEGGKRSVQPYNDTKDGEKYQQPSSKSLLWDSLKDFAKNYLQVTSVGQIINNYHRWYRWSYMNPYFWDAEIAYFDSCCECYLSDPDRHRKFTKAFQEIKGLIEQLVEVFEEVLEKSGHSLKWTEYLENHKAFTYFVQDFMEAFNYHKEKSDCVRSVAEFVKGTLEGKSHILKLIAMKKKRIGTGKKMCC